jgi:5'-deoxynucleotidase
MEFRSAANQSLSKLKSLNMPEVEYFIEHFIEAFKLTLDEIDL